MRLLIAITAGLLLLTVGAFAYGPLLPWSPIKPGYASAAFQSATVFYDTTRPMHPDYFEIDRMTAEAELFHKLKFRRPLKVIACKNWGDCSRAMPWLRVGNLGGVTMVTGDAIYITPKIEEKRLHAGEFLRHEISHALINQNTSAVSVFGLNHHEWLFEGIAVAFGHQHDYLTRAEFLERAGQTELADYLDPSRRPSPWNARFAYPTQRYFVEFIRNRYGEDRFASYLHDAIADPDRAESMFVAAFGDSFNDAIATYQQAVRAGSWPPAE